MQKIDSPVDSQNPFTPTPVWEGACRRHQQHLEFSEKDEPWSVVEFLSKRPRTMVWQSMVVLLDCLWKVSMSDSSKFASPEIVGTAGGVASLGDRASIPRSRTW